MDFNKLTLNEKFGQMFLLGLDTYEINDEIKYIINKYKIGGVVLYKNNYTSLDGMINFINNIKKINKGNPLPLFIAVDQENGRVNRFPKEINRMYNARKQRETNNLEIIEAVNTTTSYLLKRVGINMNFAPVLDIIRDEKNISIGNRSYGSTSKDVIKYGLPMMKNLKKNNIISVVKHFPGLGLTTKDSHISLSKINDIRKLKDNDLKVFGSAIEEGCDAIMTAHVKLDGYGGKSVVRNKKIIDELLKKRFNYNGLIVTDELRMNVGKIFGVKRIVRDAIEAGNDLLMIKYKRGDKYLFEKLFKKMNNFEYDIEKINNSAIKIYNIKNKYKINDEKIEYSVNVDLVNKKIKAINKAMDNGVM